jgi:hypothetical protein
VLYARAASSLCVTFTEGLDLLLLLLDLGPALPRRSSALADILTDHVPVRPC